MRYAGKFATDPDFVWNRCYPVRLESETGYEFNHHWHTIYPWLASDLTFPGAILFMGIMAYLLAQSWQDAIRGENAFAIGFFAQLLLMFFYVPANNVRLMYSEESLMFWGLLIMWRQSRARW